MHVMFLYFPAGSGPSMHDMPVDLTTCACMWFLLALVQFMCARERLLGNRHGHQQIHFEVMKLDTGNKFFFQKRFVASDPWMTQHACYIPYSCRACDPWRTRDAEAPMGGAGCGL